MAIRFPPISAETLKESPIKLRLPATETVTSRMPSVIDAMQAPTVHAPIIEAPKKGELEAIAQRTQNLPVFVELNEPVDERRWWAATPPFVELPRPGPGPSGYISNVGPLTQASAHSYAEWKDLPKNAAFYVTSASDEHLQKYKSFPGFNLKNARPSTGAKTEELLRFQTRRAELADKTVPSANLTAWRDALREGIEKSWADSPTALVRYADALEVPLVEIKLPDGKTLEMHAQILRLPRASTPLRPVDDVLRVFEQRVPMRQFEALQELLGRAGGETSMFSQMVASHHAQLARGPTHSLPYTQLNSRQRKAFSQFMTTDRHPGAAAVLLGLFLDFEGSGSLGHQLLRHDHLSGASSHSEWGSVASDLSRASPTAKRFATEPLLGKTPDFQQFLLRTDLGTVTNVMVSPTGMNELYREWFSAWQTVPGALHALAQWQIEHRPNEPWFKAFIAPSVPAAEKAVDAPEFWMRLELAELKDSKEAMPYEAWFKKWRNAPSAPQAMADFAAAGTSELHQEVGAYLAALIDEGTASAPPS